MISLPRPVPPYEDVLELCEQGITGNNELKGKFQNSKTHLLSASSNYEDLAAEDNLCSLAPVENESENIVGDLSRDDLTKVYSQYFVPEGKPAREVYSAIMFAANGRCTYCGGIGEPKNLDHYLPKTHFPQFSVLPLNLIPACRDCNMDGKATAYAETQSEQIIHPYLDHACFFNEQWLYARYIESVGSEPAVIEYYVEAPESWSAVNKERVKAHFDSFNLLDRFSREAASRSTTYIDQMRSLIALGLEIAQAKSTILNSVIDKALCTNHWERVMCLALMEGFTG